jgi:hypothetical protein
MLDSDVGRGRRRPRQIQQELTRPEADLDHEPPLGSTSAPKRRPPSARVLLADAPVAGYPLSDA